jgi:RNA polymerase sigma factor (sigma-70 family)
MGTTIATIDSAQMHDCASFGNQEREMAETLSRYLPSFYRHALRYLGNAADAEDAVQDALLSAHRHARQFRGESRMSTWLTAIVINSARMQLRRRPRQTHVSLSQQPDPGSYALSELLPDHRPTPAGAMPQVRSCGKYLAVNATALTYSAHSISTSLPGRSDHPRNERHSRCGRGNGEGSHRTGAGQA